MKGSAQNSLRLRNGRLFAFSIAALSFPFAIHLTIIGGHTVAALLMLLYPLALFLVRNRTRRLLLLALITAALTAALLARPTFAQQQVSLVYLPPILINLGLAMVFGSSLRPNVTPLITRYSILIRGKLEPSATRYTRRVTQLWAVFFIGLSIESLLLAIFASLETWSLFTNILNYLFVAILFVGEYLFRVRYLTNLDHPSFPQFLYAITRADLSELKRR